MQPLAHRTNQIIKYFITKAFKKKSKNIVSLPLKKEGKEGELSCRFISWTQCKKHQSKSSYTNYTQPIKSASHHQRWAKTSQSASIRCSKRPIGKRLAALPVQYTSYRKRRGGRERQRNIEGCRRRSQSTWKDTEKHIHDVEKREWTIHPNVQFF